MNTLIIMGHGRCLDGASTTVPAGAELSFYTPQGYAISKGLAGRLVKTVSNNGPSTVRYSGGQTFTSHYLCPSLNLEMVLRFKYAKDRVDRDNTWVVQLQESNDANKGKCIRVDNVINYFTSIHPGPVGVHWVLCRSTANKASQGSAVHVGVEGNSLPQFKMEKQVGDPVPPVVEFDAIPEERMILRSIDECQKYVNALVDL